jgi:type I restriction enzyme, S subunit
LSRTASAGFSIVMGQDMATSQDFVTWTCGPRLSPHFLLWVLRASRQDLLGRLAMGSTHKTIYFPDLEMIRIPLPPMEEQVAAVEEIRSRAALIHQALKACDRSAALIAERKRALITTCVTGEFDVAAASNRAGDAALQGVAR